MSVFTPESRILAICPLSSPSGTDALEWVVSEAIWGLGATWGCKICPEGLLAQSCLVATEPEL